MSEEKKELKNEELCKESKVRELSMEELENVTGGAAYIRKRALYGIDAPIAMEAAKGIDMQIRELAADDIETTAVMKDAASAAIYGARGAN